jgi:hypothetical protein
MRTAFTYVGALHFLVQGTLSEGGGTAVLNGAAELVGTDFVISTTFSRDKHPVAPLQDAGAFEIRMNTQTQTGTWWSLNAFFNTTTRAVDHDYAAGTLTMNACP